MFKTVIRINDVEGAKQFVNIAGKVDAAVDLRQGRYIVDGKSIMGILSLNLNEPLELVLDADDEETGLIWNKFKAFGLHGDGCACGQPDATEEDLRDICGRWKSLVDGMPEGFLQGSLQDCACTVGEGGVLSVEFRPSAAAQLLIDGKKYREELEAYLAGVTGRKVSVGFVMGEPRRS